MKRSIETLNKQNKRIKNIDKLCFCKKNIYNNDKSIKIINTKSKILRIFCENRINFYRYPVYKKYCSNVLNQIDNIIHESENCERCNDCDNQEELIILLNKLRNNIYNEKRELEKNNFQFSDFILKDFVKVIVYNIYKIIQGKRLYIEMFGGFQKS